MIFEKESLSFHIIDVLEIKQKNIDMLNSGRNFGALSLRIRSDARLTAADKEYILGDNCVAYVPSNIDYKREAWIDELIVIHLDVMDYRTEEIEFLEANKPERLRALFCDILSCWNEREIGYRLKCSAILYEIFAECHAQSFKPPVKCPKIQPSVDYIAKNYTRPDITLREIADRSFMSEVYFRKLFKEAFGVSPQKYIVSLRIQNAQGLISTGYYSLKEVAYMSGYNDYKYFSTEFKRIKGVSPSEYLYNYYS